MNNQMSVLQGKLADKDAKVFELHRECKSKDDIIDNMQKDLKRRDRNIEELNGEIARLQYLLSQGGNMQGELQHQLDEMTMKPLLCCVLLKSGHSAELLETYDFRLTTHPQSTANAN